MFAVDGPASFTAIMIEGGAVEDVVAEGEAGGEGGDVRAVQEADAGGHHLKRSFFFHISFAFKQHKVIFSYPVEVEAVPGQEMCGSGRDDELWVVELLQRPGADPEVERVRDVGVGAGVVDEEADANLKKKT